MLIKLLRSCRLLDVLGTKGLPPLLHIFLNAPLHLLIGKTCNSVSLSLRMMLLLLLLRRSWWHCNRWRIMRYRIVLLPWWKLLGWQRGV